MTEAEVEKKLEKVLMRYYERETNADLSIGEYFNFLYEIRRIFNGLGKREYRMKIFNKMYSVLYDPEILVEFNIERLKSVLGEKIDQITYKIHFKEGVKTKVSRRLVIESIEDGRLEKNKLKNCYEIYNKRYVEITEVVSTDPDVGKPVIKPSHPGYGICKRCGKPISPERLKLFPKAENCINCIKEVEAKNPRRRKKIKDDGIAGSRDDVRKGRARRWGDR